MIDGYDLAVWHVYQNGEHVAGPITYAEAGKLHEHGPNDSRITREAS